MKHEELHVKQDEWRYDCTNAQSRAKVRRARNKAKRALSKQLLKEETAA